jgi:protein TonB
MTSAFVPAPAVNTSRRNLMIASAVVLFHVAAIWALQSGLVRRTVEMIVPVALLTEIITPPAPKVEVPAPAPAPEPPKPKQPDLKKPTPKPVPQPMAKPDPAPAPNAPVVAAEPAPPAAPAAPPVAAAPSPAPAPAKVELPSSDAEYLRNPKPPYPPMSKRLGEQGKVVLRVLIAVDGSAKEATIKQSSGYDRLDESAKQTVLKWRFVPGKRGGTPEAMWFDVPVNFVLEQ